MTLINAGANYLHCSEANGAQAPSFPIRLDDGGAADPREPMAPDGETAVMN